MALHAKPINCETENVKSVIGTKVLGIRLTTCLAESSVCLSVRSG